LKGIELSMVENMKFEVRVNTFTVLSTMLTFSVNSSHNLQNIAYATAAATRSTSRLCLSIALHFTIMRSLSTDTQQYILLLLGEGLSTRQVAEQCNVSHTSVNKLHQDHLPDILPLRGGHPIKLSSQDKRSCVRAVTSGRLHTAAAATKRLREDTGVDVRDCTVRCALQNAGLKAREKKSKPKLSAKISGLALISQTVIDTGQLPIGSA
jgi:transposase